MVIHTLHSGSNEGFDNRTSMPTPNDETVRSLHLSQNKETCPKCGIPAACTECHAIDTDTQATNTVFMTGENASPLSLEGIPNIASPVVVAAKEKAARNRKGN